MSEMRILRPTLDLLNRGGAQESVLEMPSELFPANYSLRTTAIRITQLTLQTAKLPNPRGLTEFMVN